jgi:hypothetical protein
MRHEKALAFRDKMVWAGHVTLVDIVFLRSWELTQFNMPVQELQQGSMLFG